jgi:hypothetical protein
VTAFGVAVVSTGCAFAVTSPEPENVIVLKSSGWANATGFGETRSSSAVAVSWKKSKSKVCTVTW